MVLQERSARLVDRERHVVQPIDGEVLVGGGSAGDGSDDPDGAGLGGDGQSEERFGHGLVYYGPSRTRDVTPMVQQLTIEETTNGATTVLDIAGEIDLATAPQLNARIETIQPDATVVLDMSGVTFMDSTGLRVLIGAHERSKEAGGRLAVVASEGPVTKLLSITGVDAWLDLHDSLSSATDDG